MYKKAIAIVLFALLGNITFAQNKLNFQDLNDLKNLMAGSFSSELQAKNDSDFYDIHLNMKPIWESSKDGFWLYVEQAIVTSLDKPYRQRLYHVSLLNDTTIVSKVYEMKSPLRFAGAYKNTDLIKSLTVDSVEAREGCGILLHKRANQTYAGSTNKQDCLSTMRGASYATSEVVISNGLLVSWDRGWDTTNKQMWGAVKSGYQFVKHKD